MGTVGYIDQNPYIETNTFYTDNGAYVESENDQRGYKTRYTLSNATGEVSAITDPKGNVTNYTYNNTTKNLTKIKNGSSEVNYSYSGAGNGNRLTAIATGGATYNFVYDQWSNVQSVNIGNTYTLVTNTYGAQNGNLLKSTYGNGQSVEYVYDQYDRVVEVKSAQSSSSAAVTTAKYIYNADGQIARMIDKNGGKTAYTYDLSGRVTDYLTPQGNVLYGYDSLDRTGKITTEFNGLKAVTSYGYQSANRPGVTTLPEGRVEHVYDNLQRERVHEVHASEETARHLRRETSYWDVSGNRTTELLKGHANYVGTSGTDRALVDGFTRFVYTYDANGNISQKDVNGSSGYKTITYSYDSKNQLISEIDLYRGTESTYTYDASGNLLSKTKHHILPGGGTELIGAATYGYSDSVWKDRLTSYKGVDITYDTIGNPLTYYDGRTFTWEQGRRLKSSVLANGTQVSYEYNVDGIRTKKQVGNVTTTYLVDSAGTIQALKEGNETLLFMYDSTGMCEGFLWYTGTTKNGAYYYLYDGMGSVIGIVASDYTPVVYYDYDARGKPYETTGTQAATLGKLNPFRYRGYCYDEESGFYYLNSRYYNPEVGRFLIEDRVISGIGGEILGYNLYVYCFNNPVIMYDFEGMRPVVICGRSMLTEEKNKEKSTRNSDGFSKYVGSTVNLGKEETIKWNYWYVATYEKGIGYNKSFSTDKPINMYTNIPENPLEVWEYGSGVDINVYGYGCSFQSGNESAISVHANNNSFEIGKNILGRVYMKHTYLVDETYVYNKFSFNGPEIVFAVVIVPCALQLIMVSEGVGSVIHLLQ